MVNTGTGGGLGGAAELHTAMSVEIFARNLTGEGVAAARAELESLGGAIPEDQMRKQVFAQEEQRVRLTEQYYREHPNVINPMTGTTYSGTLPAGEQAKAEQMARARAAANANAQGAIAGGIAAGAGAESGSAAFKNEEQLAKAQAAQYVTAVRRDLRSVLTREMREVQRDLDQTLATMGRGAGAANLGGSMGGIPSSMQADIKAQIAKVQKDLNDSIAAMATAPMRQLEALSAELEAENKKLGMSGKGQFGAIASSIERAGTQVDLANKGYTDATARLNTAAQDRVASIMNNARTLADEEAAMLKTQAATSNVQWAAIGARMKADAADIAAAQKAAADSVSQMLAQEAALRSGSGLFPGSSGAGTMPPIRGGGGAGGSFAGGMIGTSGFPAGGSLAARGAYGLGGAVGGVAVAGALTQLYGAYQGAGLEYAITTGLAQGLPRGDEPKAFNALYPSYRRDIPQMLAQYGITDWNGGAGTIFNVLSRPGMAPQGGAKQQKAMYDETMHVMSNAAKMAAFTSTSDSPLSMDQASQAIMMLMVDTGTTGMKPGPAKDREIDRLTNILVAGHRYSAVPMEDLLSGAGRSFAQLATMGFSPEELVSGAAAMTQHGMSGSQAWTAMTMFATRLAKPTSLLGKSDEFQSALGMGNIKAHGLSNTLERIVAISRQMYYDQQHGKTFYDKAGKAFPKFSSPADIEMQLFGDIRGSQRTFSQLVGFGDTGAGSAASAAMSMQGQGFDPTASAALDSAYGGEQGISPFFTQFQSILSGVRSGAGQNSLAGYQAIITPTAEFQFHKMVADFKELADVMNGPLSGSMAGFFHNVDGVLEAIASFEKAHKTTGGIISDALLGVGAIKGVGILERVLLGTSNEKELTAGVARYLGTVLKGVPGAVKELWSDVGSKAAVDMASGISSKAGVAAIDAGVAEAMAATGASVAATGAGAAVGTATAGAAAATLGVSVAGAISASIAVALPILVGVALGHVLEWASSEVGDWETAHQAQQLHTLQQQSAKHATDVQRLHVAQSGGAAAYLGARQTDLTRIFGARGPLAARYSWNNQNMLGDQSLAMAHAMSVWGMSHAAQAHDVNSVARQFTAQLGANPKALQDALVGFYEHMHGQQAPMRGTKAFTDLVASPDFVKWFGAASTNKHLIGNIALDLAREFSAYWPHSPAEKGPLATPPDLAKWIKGNDWMKTLADVASLGNDLGTALVGGAGGASTNDPTGGLHRFLPPGGVPTGNAGTAAAHRVLLGRQGQGGGYWQYASFGSTIVDPMLVRRVRSGMAYLPAPRITGSEQDFAYDLFSSGQAGPMGGGPTAVTPGMNLTGRDSALGTMVTGGSQLAHLRAIADATKTMARAAQRPKPLHISFGRGADPATSLRGRGIALSH